MPLFCIICGYSAGEVKKLFCFPRNSKKCKMWQQSLGMSYQYHVSTHIRVCNRHFESTCFKPFVTPLTLYGEAIPTLLPANNTSAKVKQLPTLIIQSAVTEHNYSKLSQEDNTQLSIADEYIAELPSTSSKVVTPVTCHARKSVFQDIQCIGRAGGGKSSNEKKIISIIKKKKVQLMKLKRKYKERCFQIKDLNNITNSVEVHNIFKGMSPMLANFVIAQIRCNKRSQSGRWTLDDKIMALAICERSPKCYSLLRRLLYLPSTRTLQNVLQKVPFNVGVNEQIFEHLGECLSKHSEKDKLCSLVFDEIAIKERVQYNPSKDCIEGIEDFGHYHTNRLANYALVFLAQGISKPWKQPVAYYFSHGRVTSSELESALREVLCSMAKANIPVATTVCDTGNANVTALKNLGSDVLHPFFNFKGRQIFTLFDVPHLLKCVRNLFKKYNVLIPTSIVIDGNQQIAEARWSDIEKAYEEDKTNPLIFRSLYKIKDNYLEPVGQNAMKTKIAAQTLSHTMATYIYNLVKEGILPPRAVATATFVNDVDQIFDSCNASARKKPDGKPLKCIVTKHSGHVPFWKEVYNKMKQWQFIRIPADINITTHWKAPSQIGWLHNLNALPLLWRYMQTLGLDSMRTRSLNQDGLKDLFGSIRSGCGYNKNPTVSQFVRSLKIQVINGLKNDLKDENCEDDEISLLSNLRSFLETDDIQQERLNEGNNETVDSNDTVSINNVYSVSDIVKIGITGTVKSLSVVYVAGFIAKRIFSSFTCEVCKNDLSSDDLPPCNQFIFLKEFCDSRNKLFYPSEKIVVSVGHGITVIENYLPTLFKENHIKARIGGILKEKIDLTWLSCASHFDYVQNCVISSLCYIGIPWYCRRFIRDLKSQAKNM